MTGVLRLNIERKLKIDDSHQYAVKAVEEETYMSIADIEMLFKFVGGLGMFLYGMHVMADGLQKSAGGKMKQLLGVLTNHRILGVLVGTLVTAIIQSSSATTVMVVGFVNAGIISLTQALVLLWVPISVQPSQAGSYL